MIDRIDELCEHRVDENGIHELILRDHGRRGADAYLEQLELLYQQWINLDEPLLVLLNPDGGSLPISYTIQRGKELSARYPDRGEVYAATLTDNSMEARIVETFMRAINFNDIEVRFFEERRRDKAIGWLLQYR